VELYEPEQIHLSFGGKVPIWFEFQFV